MAAQTAHVFELGGRQCRLRHIDDEQQVLGVLMVVLDASRDPVVPETEVHRPVEL